MGGSVLHIPDLLASSLVQCFQAELKLLPTVCVVGTTPAPSDGVTMMQSDHGAMPAQVWQLQRQVALMSMELQVRGHP